MTRSGEYRTPITWYKNIQTNDPTSLEPVTGYALVGTDWAAVEWESGKLFEAAKKLNSEVQGLVRVHYRGDVKPGWRFKIVGRWVSIIALSDYKEKHRELWVTCKEALD